MLRIFFSSQCLSKFSFYVFWVNFRSAVAAHEAEAEPTDFNTLSSRAGFREHYGAIIASGRYRDHQYEDVTWAFNDPGAIEVAWEEQSSACLLRL